MSLTTGTRQSNADAWRIPAGDLDGLVIDRLRALLSDEGELFEMIYVHAAGGAGTKQLIERARRIAVGLTDKSPGEIRPLVISLLNRVEIRSDVIEIEIHRKRLLSLLEGAVAAPPEPGVAADTNSGDVVTLKIAARLQRTGREMRMVVQNADDEHLPDASLLRVLARAHDIQARLTQDPDLTVQDIGTARR